MEEIEALKYAVEMLKGCPWVDNNYSTKHAALKILEPKTKTGHWIVTDAWPHKVYCSECYKTFAQASWEIWQDGSLPRNYCPNCGRKMEGKTKIDRTNK